MGNLENKEKQSENQLVINKPFSLVPSTLAEAMKYAEIIANSDIVPKHFKGKPGDVLVAIQMGAEVGISPLQSVQNIQIINGKASLWGDAALALVQTHPLYEAHEEYIEGTGFTYEKLFAELNVEGKSGMKSHLTVES